MALNIQNSPVQQFLDANNNVVASLDGNGNWSNFGGLVPDNGSAGSTGFHQVKVTLTSAQLLALKATPITIVAAPGAGLMIQVDALSFYYKFGATGYTLNAGTLKLFMGPAANAKALCASQATGLIDQAANRAVPFVALLNPGALTDAQALNVDLVVANDGAAEFTLGDGTVDVIVAYSVVKA